MKMTLSNTVKAKKLFIGVLSGTSMNSIDAVLVDFSSNKVKILDYINFPFNKRLSKELLNIINVGQCNLATLGRLDRKLGIEFAKAVNKLLIRSNYNSEQIIAIGSHGQNIWHSPSLSNTITIQIGDPNIISAYTKILTVADFRRKDAALGGQGAPLAPGLHAAIFRSKAKNRAIINIGGISNITLLCKNYKIPVIGFDLGPGNCLMDEWVQAYFPKVNCGYDLNGNLASQGKLIPKLLEICLQDPYFKKPYPKSTGREYFNQAWLFKKIKLAKIKILKSNLSNLSQHKNILATLLHLTAQIIKRQIISLNKLFSGVTIEEIYLCGGGAKNLYLLKLLQQIMDCPVKLTDELGITTDLVEAVLFAWLAKQTIENKNGNLPSVTGANCETILGGIYLP